MKCPIEDTACLQLYSSSRTKIEVAIGTVYPKWAFHVGIAQQLVVRVSRQLKPSARASCVTSSRISSSANGCSKDLQLVDYRALVVQLSWLDYVTVVGIYYGSHSQSWRAIEPYIDYLVVQFPTPICMFALSRYIHCM